MENPRLIEPGAKYFFNETLKKYKLKNTKYNNDLVNFLLLLFFIIILFSILYFKKKTKVNKKNILDSNLEKQQYILQQMQKARIKKQQNSPNLITNLPRYQNEFDKLP